MFSWHCYSDSNLVTITIILANSTQPFIHQLILPSGYVKKVLLINRFSLMVYSFYLNINNKIFQVGGNNINSEVK